MTLSALPALEYDLVVNQWPLARLYVWLLARHADSFGSAVQKAIAEFHKPTNNN